MIDMIDKMWYHDIIWLKTLNIEKDVRSERLVDNPIWYIGRSVSKTFMIGFVILLETSLWTRNIKWFYQFNKLNYSSIDCLQTFYEEIKEKHFNRELLFVSMFMCIQILF